MIPAKNSRGSCNGERTGQGCFGKYSHPPDYHAAKKLIFELFRFGIEHDIEDIKLIELDTAAITVPYIESFLRAIVSEPELMELPVLWKESHIPL